MARAAARRSSDANARRGKAPDLSALYRPQLARLVKSPPSGDEWLHEMKYDGYRIGALVRDGSVTLVSRNGNDWTAAFPEVAEAVRGLGVRNLLLDGEVAIVLPDGRTSFQALQNAFSGGPRSGLVYFVFDVLRVGGESLDGRPLEERKAALLTVVGKAASRIRYSEHVAGRGDKVFAEACRLRLEGIISKRRDAAYKAGRADTWLKTKCVLRQEFVIGGFTDPEGRRQGIGALLAGYYDGEGALVFAGKVGTGFTTEAARELRKRLDALEVREPPFNPRPAGWLGKHAHWVKPALVAEVVFTEWTQDGRIRHPSFQGLRQDKGPGDVSRESSGDARGPVPRAPGRTKRTARTAERVEVAGVSISHGDRVIYPDQGVTKLDLARFYERIADEILPHIADRPLTLVRCPEGLAGECFYMKHSKVWAPKGVRHVKIQEKKKIGDYLVVDTVQALVGLIQMGVLEIHTWNSRGASVEVPDRLVFDLDPGTEVPWADVIDAAKLVRRLLEDTGLESFVKTTGGKGLHVVVPLRPKARWEECLAFARGLAGAMERLDPGRFTTAFAKAGRERKILIDYLRNNRTNTSIAAFSTRARAGATVSVPLRWTELKPSLDPASFNVDTVPERLRRLRSDPWGEYWRATQRLPRVSFD